MATGIRKRFLCCPDFSGVLFSVNPLSLFQNSKLIHCAMEKEFKLRNQPWCQTQHFDVIDIPQMVKECKRQMVHQNVTKVNDACAGWNCGRWISLHKHDNDDEFSLCWKEHYLLTLKTDHWAECRAGSNCFKRSWCTAPERPKRTVMLMVETRDYSYGGLNLLRPFLYRQNFPSWPRIFFFNKTTSN